MASPGGAPLHHAPARQVWLALLGVWIIWGTTYLAIRVMVDTIPPFLGAALRFLTAGTLVYVVAIRRGDRTGDRPTRAHWKAALIIGIALPFGGNGLVSVAEQSVASGIAALLVAIVPLWLALFDRVLFGKRLAPVALAGLVTGFVGAAMLVNISIEEHTDPWGIALIIIATLAWTLGSLYTRTAALPSRPMVGAGMQMVCGGGVLLLASLVTREPWRLDIDSISGDSIAALLYLTFLGGIVAYSCYTWLIRHAPTPLVATYAYVNPVVAVALGAMILDEPIGLRTVIAGGIIVASVAAIVSTQKPPADVGEEREAVAAASGE